MLRTNQFLGKALCLHNNAVVFIFEDYSQGMPMCADKPNVFSVKNHTVSLVHSAKAWVSFADPSSRHRTELGAIEGKLACVYVPTPELEIESGSWVYINYLNRDLMGGYLERINRNRLDSILHLDVDLGKPVPFSPNFVGVGDWKRGPQV